MSAEFDSVVLANLDQVPDEFRPLVEAFTSSMSDAEKGEFVAAVPRFLDAFARDDYPAFRDTLASIGYGDSAAMVYAVLDQNRDRIGNATPAV